MANLKWLLILVLSTCFEVSVTGQENTSLLWMIEGKDLSSPSFIYGTIHLICEEDFHIHEEVMKAIHSSEKIVMELDMDDPGFMGKMQQMSVYPGMKNHSDKLSESDLSTLDGFFKAEYNVGMDKLGVMRPIGLLSMLIIKMAPCENEQMASYEGSFIAIAKDDSIPLDGLETLEDQFGVFDSIPLEEQYSWLTNYINNSTEFEGLYRKLIKAYKDKNIENIFQIIAQSEEMEGFVDELLIARNKKWIPKMNQMMRESSTFFAVGAGHLGSENGVIELLKKEGYRLSPVAFN